MRFLVLRDRITIRLEVDLVPWDTLVHKDVGHHGNVLVVEVQAVFGLAQNVCKFGGRAIFYIVQGRVLRILTKVLLYFLVMIDVAKVQTLKVILHAELLVHLWLLLLQHRQQPDVSICGEE